MNTTSDKGAAPTEPAQAPGHVPPGTGCEREGAGNVAHKAGPRHIASGPSADDAKPKASTRSSRVDVE